MASSKEKILNNITEALKNQVTGKVVDNEFNTKLQHEIISIVPQGIEGLINQFKKELEVVSGEFHLLNTIDDGIEIVLNALSEMQSNKLVVTSDKHCQDLTHKLKNQIEQIEIIKAAELKYPARKNVLSEVAVALIEAHFAIADIGSLVVLYEQSQTSLPHFLSDCVIVLVEQKNVLPNQYTLFEKLTKEQAKDMVFITGPSRTADIEKVLILGAHGPRKLIVLMITSNIES